MRGRLHHAFRIDVARAGIGAFVAGDALPDDVLVAQQLVLHAQADQVDPVARVEVRVDGVDRAGVGAGAALPAAVDELAARQRRDLLLHLLVVVGDRARIDERAPMPGDVDAFDLQMLVGDQVLRPDQRFFVDRHRCFLYELKRRCSPSTWATPSISLSRVRPVSVSTASSPSRRRVWRHANLPCVCPQKSPRRYWPPLSLM